MNTKQRCSLGTRTISLLLALSLTMMLLPAPVFATSDNASDDQTNSLGELSGYLAGNAITTAKLYAERQFYQPGGWGFAAERGNNLIDRVKGLDASVVGDDNAANGPDRKIINRDGSITWIQDKYYSSAAPFVIPPLRERSADILLLTIQQLRYIQDNLGLKRTVSPADMTAMLEYDWPGNIRQLTSVLERMAFMSDNVLMDSLPLLQQCLSANKQFQQMQTIEEAQPQPKTLKELMAEYEIKIINQHVAQYGTLRKAAAFFWGSHSLLSYKLKKHYESDPSTSCKEKVK